MTAWIFLSAWGKATNHSIGGIVDFGGDTEPARWDWGLVITKKGETKGARAY